jgi:hypothetical protein
MQSACVLGAAQRVLEAQGADPGRQKTRQECR